jgi:uncharacterized glyoxalase superfamily protein PhnB
MKNRSVPVDTVLPHIVYKNLPAAMEWLNKAFGFREHYRYGEQSGAQMHLDNAYIMVRSARPGDATAKPGAEQTASLTVFVEDVDAHFRQANAAGARIVEELHEVMYGEKQYGVEDLEGHRWLFSQHVRDVSPEEWGAKVAGR